MIATMRVPFSYLDRQFAQDSQLTKDIFDDLCDLAASGDFTLGKPVLEFEARAKDYFGLEPQGGVVGVHNGTEALVLCLKAEGIGPDDEVIVPTSTFFATAAAVVEVGATPVFCDVDEWYSLDPDKLLDAYHPGRTKAVIPVHWYGIPARMDRIMEFANAYGLAVIEDACAAVGAEDHGRKVGSMGHINAISLHPLKTLHVWGDGGAVLTNDPEMLDWLRVYRNHGMVDRDHIAMWGLNCRLHSTQAVVANRGFAYLEDWTERRIEVAGRLDAGLRGVDGVTIPPRIPGRKNAYQLYVVQCERRAHLLAYLEAHGVEAKIHYPLPLHLQKPGRELGYGPGDFPVAEAQAERILSLPCSQYLTEQEVDYMVATIEGFYS